jgi:penicillin G amidase
VPSPKAVQIPLRGLVRSSRIRIDRWGIPHIEADNDHDLFFAQGFNAARDRLWQIDLWRKRGLGLLAADFGPGYLAQDKAVRLFLYRGDMGAEWRSYAPDAKQICEAFVSGINAYIEAVDQECFPLPYEFGLLGTRPARWAPEDVVRIRTHGLVGNAQSEIARSILLAAGLDQADRLRQKRSPEIEVVNHAQIDLDVFSTTIIDFLKLASAPVTFSPERLDATLAEAARWSIVDDSGVVAKSDAQGSNSWAVHGRHTETGYPILASDPHRILGMPSIRYLVHLTAPGMNVIGAGEPCVPGISIGHNDRIAFGLTIFDADQEDVYLYATNPADPHSYRFGDRWEPMSNLLEHFEVKGAPIQEERFFFTRHGPVVLREERRNIAVAIATVWSEPGSAPYLASLSTMRARNFQEFDLGLARWKAPPVNKTFADIEGHIAWTPAGFMPRRSGWNGMLPVSGSGEFEWNGHLSRAEMPRILDPASGFVATANEYNLPPNWDHAAKPIGFEWSETSRSVRIRRILAESRHSLSRAEALQTDRYSIPAERLCHLLAALAPHEPDARNSCNILMSWDAVMGGDSSPAALFDLWWLKHLRPALIRHVCPALGTHEDIVGAGDVDAILDLLEETPSRFAPLIERTLAAAMREAEELLGREPSQWRWGLIHQALFRHPLSDLEDNTLDLDIGPFPLGGDSSTPMHAAPRLSDKRITHGASVRLIMDIGAWDRSLCINTPGQSGDPHSKFYANLAPIWARGSYVPLLFSKTAVEAATEMIIDLIPAARD